MKVWIFVEGSSDVKALSALLNGWKQQLSAKERLGHSNQYLLPTSPTTSKKSAHERPRNW